MLIDVNVSFGNWPFQTFLQNSVAKLSKHLKSEGISLALVSSIETTLYPDPDVYNKSLLKKVKSYSNLIPVMVLNPALSDWKEKYEEYTDSQKFRVIKILPNYHNYLLSSKFVNDFMNELSKKKNAVLIVQMRVEDERNQYPLLKVSGVDYKEIIKLANRFPGVSIICLCSCFREAVSLVKETKNIYIDISFIETLNIVFKTNTALLKEIPAGRILFGSHTPFLYTRSAIMKVKSAEISEKDLNAIMFNNARCLLGIVKSGSKG